MKITTLVDDLDGSTKDVTSFTFSFSGVVYSLDLSPANIEAFRQSVAMFVKAAEKAVPPSKPKRVQRSKQDRGYDPQQVREWQAATGRKVSTARFPKEDLEAYLAQK
jgi:hypothetical protein